MPRGNRTPFEVRFWSKVIKGGEDDCWIWTGAKQGLRGEYGTVTYNGKRMGAHCASYRYHYGDYPDGLDVLHDCDNPACVNPKHLKIGTHTQNMQEKMEKGRGNHVLGTKHHNAKLDPDKVRDIRRSINEGVTIAQLAKRYNVSYMVIYQVVIGRTWYHVA